MRTGYGMMNPAMRFHTAYAITCAVIASSCKICERAAVLSLQVLCSLTGATHCTLEGLTDTVEAIEIVLVRDTTMIP